MATFLGLDLFSSGPHRLRVVLAGRFYLPPLANINNNANTLDITTAELEIEQRGRLVAGSDTALWQLYQAIADVAEAASGGTLALDSGQQWTDMRMLRFLPGETVDRGRLVSMPYTIEYRRIAL
jgi:hypothetical protein